MSGAVRKRAVGAAAQGINGFVGLANFVIFALGSRTMDPNAEKSRQIPYIDLQDRSGNANFGAQVSHRLYQFLLSTLFQLLSHISSYTS